MNNRMPKKTPSPSSTPSRHGWEAAGYFGPAPLTLRSHRREVELRSRPRPNFEFQSSSSTQSRPFHFLGWNVERLCPIEKVHLQVLRNGLPRSRTHFSRREKKIIHFQKTTFSGPKRLILALFLTIFDPFFAKKYIFILFFSFSYHFELRLSS